MEEPGFTPQPKPPSKRVPPPVETRWKPGQSGNPGGRQKGIMRRFQDAFDRANVLEFLENMASGKTKAGVRERLEAVKLLTDRAYGRAVNIEMQVDPSSELGAELSDDVISALARGVKAVSLEVVDPKKAGKAA